MSNRENGTVKWFDNAKGYGFISRASGQEDVFVHFRQIRGEGYRTLQEGQQVQFSVVQGQIGLGAVRMDGDPGTKPPVGVEAERVRMRNPRIAS